jgi:hypothetical protein
MIGYRESTVHARVRTVGPPPGGPAGPGREVEHSSNPPPDRLRFCSRISGFSVVAFNGRIMR